MSLSRKPGGAPILIDADPSFILLEELNYAFWVVSRSTLESGWSCAFLYPGTFVCFSGSPACLRPRSAACSSVCPNLLSRPGPAAWKQKVSFQMGASHCRSSSHPRWQSWDEDSKRAGYRLAGGNKVNEPWVRAAFIHLKYFGFLCCSNAFVCSAAKVKNCFILLTASLILVGIGKIPC